MCIRDRLKFDTPGLQHCMIGDLDTYHYSDAKIVDTKNIAGLVMLNHMWDSVVAISKKCALVLMNEDCSQPNACTEITAHNLRQPTMAIDRIKDRYTGARWAGPRLLSSDTQRAAQRDRLLPNLGGCLLYTSDAADE